ncbi:MAG: hypothetical protein H6834_12270 [Planctomycetes bacterium]|nr:hypothetical protein [Planctomycetota bacterium]
MTRRSLLVPNHSQAHGVTRQRGASEVGAVWFCLILGITLVCLGAYLHFEARIAELRAARANGTEALKARLDYTELRRAQHVPLMALTGRSADVQVAGVDLRVVRPRHVKEFAQEVESSSRGLLDAPSQMNAFKSDFYLKRLYDKNRGIVPAIDGIEGVSVEGASGEDAMNELRKGLVHPFGRATTSVRSDADGGVQVDFSAVKEQWTNFYDDYPSGEDLDAEVDAIFPAVALSQDKPNLGLVTILQGMALGYRHLDDATEQLKAVAEAGRAKGSDARWNSLENVAKATLTGTASGLPSKLQTARTDIEKALAQALGSFYDASGSAAGDEVVQRFVDLRRSAAGPQAVVALEEAGGAPGEELVDAADAKSELERVDGEMRTLEGELGWTDGKRRIGVLLDDYVAQLDLVDSLERIGTFYPNEEASVEGFRAATQSAAERVRDGVQGVLAQTRVRANDYKDTAEAYAQTRGAIPGISDTFGRTIKSEPESSQAKDIADALKLVYDETTDPVPPVDDVISVGPGDITNVVALIEDLKRRQDTERTDEVEPAIDGTIKKLRRDGRRLGDLLVSNRFFIDIARGSIVGDPTTFGQSEMRAIIDLSTKNNIAAGMRFGVYEPKQGGARHYKAVAVVLEVGPITSRVALRYLPGVDPVTDPVTKGDWLSNPVYNPVYRRNAVVIAPPGSEYLVRDVAERLTPNHFQVQEEVTENSDMVVLVGRREDLFPKGAVEDLGDEVDLAPWFQEHPAFIAAQQRGLSVFFFDNDIEPLIPGSTTWMRSFKN